MIDSFKKNNIKYFMILIIAINSFSCQENEETVNTLEIPIVFGKRDVDSVRTTLLIARDMVSSSREKARLRSLLAWHSMATAELTLLGAKEINGVCSGVSGDVTGSGVLTSDSRMVTADHIIFPGAYYNDSLKDPCFIEARFEFQS
jgi:hypothetical protein